MTVLFTFENVENVGWSLNVKLKEMLNLKVIICDYTMDLCLVDICDMVSHLYIWQVGNCYVSSKDKVFVRNISVIFW